MFANLSQRNYRGYRARRRMKEQLLVIKLTNRRERKQQRHNAALMIQLAYKRKVARRYVQDKRVHLAAARIQGLYRGWRDRQYVIGFRKLYYAALMIQRQYRRKLARVMVKAIRVQRSVIRLSHSSLVFINFKKLINSSTHSRCGSADYSIDIYRISKTKLDQAGFLSYRIFSLQHLS